MILSSVVSFLGGPIIARLAQSVSQVALMALIGLFLARLFWLVVAPVPAVSSVTPSAASAPAPSNARFVPNLAVLTTQNPFAPMVAEQLEEIGGSVPETALNLKLQGVRASTNAEFGRQSSAIIVTPDNRQNVFVAGDKILEDVVLARILSDRVILDKSGSFEALYLEGRDGGLRVLGGVEPRQAVGGREQIEPSVFQLNSASTLLAVARLVPSSNGGLRIVPAGSPERLAEIGLAPGDQLVSVDGRAVSELDYDEVVGRLRNMNRVRLTLRRGQQTTDVTLVFEERAQ